MTSPLTSMKKTSCYTRSAMTRWRRQRALEMKKQISSPNGCALLCISVLAHSEYLARNHIRVSRSLTALRTGSAIKLFLSDDVDLPEPLCGFCPGVDFAEGQVVIARRRLTPVGGDVQRHVLR